MMKDVLTEKNYAALQMVEILYQCLAEPLIDEKKEPWREIDPDAD